MEARQVFGSRGEAWQKRPRVYFCSQCGGKCEEKLVYGEPRDVCTSCGHRHAARPGAAVAVLVVDKGGVLLCKRAAPLLYGGYWCLPSGAIEFGEDFLTAGRRETEEETGVRVAIKSLLSAVTNFWSYGNSNLVAVLLDEPVEGTPHPTPESEAVAWFAPENLPDLCWEADRHIIDRYFATRLAGAPVDPHYATFEAAETRSEPPPSTLFPA